MLNWQTTKSAGNRLLRVRVPTWPQLPTQEAYHRNETVANNCNFDKKVAKALNSLEGDARYRVETPASIHRVGIVFRPKGPAVPIARANGPGIWHPRDHPGPTGRPFGWHVPCVERLGRWPAGNPRGVGSWPDGPGYLNEWPVGPKRIEHGPMSREPKRIECGPMGRGPKRECERGPTGRWFAITAQRASSSNSLGQRPRNLTSP